MTAELCDNFKSKKQGAIEIFKLCKKIKHNCLFYTKEKKEFTKKIGKNYKNFISMNWYLVGKYFSRQFKDLIIVDFGSTTTDFVCIKNFKIVNKGFDDFTRLSNREMFYSGVTRTPIFGLQHEIFHNKKKYSIVPEFFSNTSDIYRINNFLEKDFDIDDEANNGKKGNHESLLRISRSFCIDFEINKKKLIFDLSKILIYNQIKKINSNIFYLQKKHKLKKNTPVLFTGIGSKILEKKIKGVSILKIDNLVKAKNLKLLKFSAHHMPAFCVAQLVSSLNN